MLILLITIVALIAIVAFIVLMFIGKARVEHVQAISVACLSEYQDKVGFENLSLSDQLIALGELVTEIESNPDIDSLNKEIMVAEIRREHFTLLAHAD